MKFRWKEGNLVATLCIQKKDEGQDKKSFSYSVCVFFSKEEMNIYHFRISCRDKFIH